MGRRALIGCMLFLLGAASASPRTAHAGDGWWGDLDKGQSARLSDVVASPEAYRGRTITFVCVFHQREHEFNPLRSRFNVERYDNVSVWPDGKAVWLAGDFEKDFPFLYVERTRPQRDEFLRLPVFTRVEVTGRIEAVIDGSPFIEMTSFRPTGHRLGKDVVDMMMRAETYSRSGEIDAKEIAADNAQSALEDAPDLAPIYAVRIRARLAELLKATGRLADAERVLAGERLGPASHEFQGAPGAQSGPAAFPAANLPGAPIEEGSAPALGNLPGTPIDEPAPSQGKSDAPGSFPGEYERQFRDVRPPPGAAPQHATPSVPEGPFRPSLPGIPMDEPAAPLPPLKGAAFPPPQSAPVNPPSKAPATLPPPQVKTPSALPPPPAPSAGAPAAPPTFPPPPPIAAPEVVDPPLPPPAPGGKPPVRRPRLAGVK